jgi:hypothetical protein
MPNEKFSIWESAFIVYYSLLIAHQLITAFSDP